MFSFKPYFTTLPRVCYSHKHSEELKRDVWVVTNSFSFVFQFTNGEEYAVSVPEGYIVTLDLPWLIQRTIRIFQKGIASAIVYEWLLETRAIEEMGREKHIPLKTADELFQMSFAVHNKSLLRKILLRLLMGIWSLNPKRPYPRVDPRKRKLERRTILL